MHSKGVGGERAKATTGQFGWVDCCKCPALELVFGLGISQLQLAVCVAWTSLIDGGALRGPGNSPEYVRGA